MYYSNFSIVKPLFLAAPSTPEKDSSGSPGRKDSSNQSPSNIEDVSRFFQDLYPLPAPKTPRASESTSAPKTPRASESTSAPKTPRASKSTLAAGTLQRTPESRLLKKFLSEYKDLKPEEGLKRILDFLLTDKVFENRDLQYGVDVFSESIWVTPSKVNSCSKDEEDTYNPFKKLKPSTLNQLKKSFKKPYEPFKGYILDHKISKEKCAEIAIWLLNKTRENKTSESENSLDKLLCKLLEEKKGQMIKCEILKVNYQKTIEEFVDILKEEANIISSENEDYKEDNACFLVYLLLISAPMNLKIRSEERIYDPGSELDLTLDPKSVFQLVRDTNSIPMIGADIEKWKGSLKVYESKLDELKKQEEREHLPEQIKRIENRIVETKARILRLEQLNDNCVDAVCGHGFAQPPTLDEAQHNNGASSKKEVRRSLF
jgi:hypothetical protein